MAKAYRLETNKDLEILEILKERLTIEIGYYDSDDCCETFEYIAYNGQALNIENQEEFDKIKEWLENEWNYKITRNVEWS